MCSVPLRFDSPARAQPPAAQSPAATRCTNPSHFNPQLTRLGSAVQPKPNKRLQILLGNSPSSRPLPAAAPGRSSSQRTHTQAKNHGIPATASARLRSARHLCLSLSAPRTLFHEGPSGAKGVLGWGKGQTRQTPLGSPFSFLPSTLLNCRPRVQHRTRSDRNPAVKRHALAGRSDDAIPSCGAAQRIKPPDKAHRPPSCLLVLAPPEKRDTGPSLGKDCSWPLSPFGVDESSSILALQHRRDASAHGIDIPPARSPASSCRRSSEATAASAAAWRHRHHLLGLANNNNINNLFPPGLFCI
ncbi:hypothetical protein TgHK011_005794 [Trichoderma gracile]|nr:hypothetical protein TgHK011_005794 [Trichoderma gracile]